MLFGSLVELHTWLHSCLCFSPFEKLFLKSWFDTSSIASYLSSFLNFFLSQSQQHLYTWWIDQESFWPLDSSSTPGGSIEHHSCLWCFSSSTASRHFVYRRCIFLDTCLTDGSTPPRHLICQDLLMVFNTPRAIRSSLLSISLSFFQTFLLTNLSHSLQTSSLRTLKLSSSLSSLGKLLISFIYMHFMF